MEEDPGMDIDAVKEMRNKGETPENGRTQLRHKIGHISREVSENPENKLTKLGPENEGKEEGTLGGMLSRISVVDPMLETWAEVVNGKNGCAIKTGAAYGDVGLVGRVDVTEMYSPPRVTIEAKKFGLRPGEAMDLLTGYDFDREEDRKKAWEHIETEKPKLIVGPRNAECSVLCKI